MNVLPDKTMSSVAKEMKPVFKIINPLRCGAVVNDSQQASHYADSPVFAFDVAQTYDRYRVTEGAFLFFFVALVAPWK